jgi:hypothetical protein
MPDEPDSLVARTQALLEVVRDIIEQKTLRGWEAHMKGYLLHYYGPPAPIIIRALEQARIGHAM